MTATSFSGASESGRLPATGEREAPGASRVSVLLADDHPVTRREIREALEAHPSIWIVGEAADAAAAVHLAIRRRPDVCLLDIHMPGHGIAAAWEITSRLRRTKVVMLTVSDDERDLFNSLRAGAAGYLLKAMDPTRLPHALLDVAAGETAIPRWMMAKIVGEFRDRGPRRRKVLDDVAGTQLTTREWQVLNLLREGAATHEIASRLVLSQATVRSHVASILKKLRVPDRDAAVRLFSDR